ncbi:MAG: substrate-binding domain-containing protein [Clostridiaceae bacterium]|nr:substrate-binding domain-containing protein [Clostridiaceae bacterium]
MKKVLSILMAVLMLFVLVACAGTGEPAKTEGTEDEGLDIGIVLPTREETRWLGDEANFKKLIKDQGLNAEILFSQNDSELEKSNVETFLSKNAKVIILCPFDADAAVATVENAKAEGATVISYDRLIMDTDGIDYYTTFDNMYTGTAMGQYLIDQADGRKGLNLYLYSGALTDNNSFIYFEGAWKVLQPQIANGTFIIQNCDTAVKYKDKLELTHEEQFEILNTIDTEWSMEKSKQLAEAHLTASGPEAKGEVFVLTPADDDCARALSDVFRGDGDIDTWHITGADGVEGSVQYIIDGYQSMTVYQDTFVLAEAAIDIAKAIIAGETPPTNSSFNNGFKEVPSEQCDAVVVTRDNIVEVFFDGGVYDGDDYVNWK